MSITKSKLFYITTPIFYVNAAPHIGHFYSACIADCIYRYEKLRNRSSKYIFSTGTDEHGTKIQQAAKLHNRTPEEYCNQISQSYKQLFDKSNIKYTHFNRTTEKTHHLPAVHHFWNTLADKGFIYKSNYAGWYCVSDETFLTQSQLKENEKKELISAESGHPVKWIEESNYMFKLSQLHENVEYWIKNSHPIRPSKFEKILLHFLNEPLEDISISRPSDRVNWAIPVPNDESQTIYVWLDALVNYLTSANYPHPDFSENWPPAHVIGKDILKFHGIYWPAFLIAAGLEPPSRLFVHSHWTVDDKKMSKSKNNVVDPNVVATKYTYEGLRYFLLREGTSHSDGNYSEIKITRIINAELVNTLGNLLSRVCAKAVNSQQIIPALDKQHLNDYDSCLRLVEKLYQLPATCETHFDSNNFYLAIDEIVSTLHMTNGMLQETNFWSFAKDPAMNNQLNAILALVFESLRICAIILQPVIPNMSERILNTLNVQERSWDDARLSFDIDHMERSLHSNSNKLMERIK